MANLTVTKMLHIFLVIFLIVSIKTLARVPNAMVTESDIPFNKLGSDPSKLDEPDATMSTWNARSFRESPGGPDGLHHP
ncbi:unnamed protein product [Camellia sinensis]